MKFDMSSNVVKANCSFNVFDEENEDRVRVFTAYPYLEKILYDRYFSALDYSDDKLMATYEYTEYQYEDHVCVFIKMGLKALFKDEWENRAECIEETLYYQYTHSLVTKEDKDYSIIVETDRCTGDASITAYNIEGNIISNIVK